MSVVSYDSFLARVGPPNTEQAVGNAQLMAAAPDLLKALEMVMNDAALLRVRSDLYTIDGGTLATVAAAIAKATWDET
jgi:hypothetical protein